MLQAEPSTRRIKHMFYMYSQPRLGSERLFEEVFQPTEVIVLSQLEGWISVLTLRGERWVRLRDERAYLEEPLHVHIPPERVYGADTPLIMHIPWLFYVYTEPDFGSDKAGSFSPQYVRIM